MFKPQAFLVESVSSRDLKKIRVALSTYLSKNPTDEQNEITNALKYIDQHFDEDIWDNYDGRLLEQDQTKWTKDYLAHLKSDLRINFSKERFEHIIEVGKTVRKKKSSLSAPVPSEMSPVEQSIHIKRRNSREKNSRLALGIVAGIGIILLVTYMVKK